ncbi:MAG TPA: hypothetical protein VJG32_08205 [Anaerolineae bacterium]|nr:hypothetical protein [Anaerolineae bacterium]
MSLAQLVLKNISGSAFRSWIVALCVLVVAGIGLAVLAISLFRNLLVV